MENQLRVLAIAIHPSVRKFILEQVKSAEISEVRTVDDFLNGSEKWTPDAFDVVMCGVGWSDLSPLEIAQNLKMALRGVPTFFVGHDSQVQESKLLLKNGFEECFYVPMDTGVFGPVLREIERNCTGETQRRRVAVATFDLRPGEKLDFEVSVFLAANNKYIKINHKGQALEEKHLSKLSQSAVSQVYVDEDQLPSYFKFIATQVKSWASDAQKLKSATRKLFHDLLSPAEGMFEDGRSFAECTAQIVSEFVGSREIVDIHKELMVQVGYNQEGLYELSQKIAAMAALISFGSKRGKSEDVAMAALFCDLFHSRLPDELRDPDLSTLSKEQKEQVQGHPAGSLGILGHKRMIVLPTVREAIMQHHERADGQGYPANLPGHKISDEAQVLSFTLQLEQIMRVKPGQRRPTLEEAYESIAKTGSIRHDVLSDIRRLLLANLDSKQTAQSA